ncbi:Fucose 4-O-acetylase [Chitinophaga jiangningensis]|uniref:Fucose 4-O-acetylase n=1 Tax=Chitinophaga jiangningensis TaxID=1419482 RepID=A0A1M7MPH5_9BACT|nr:acyltransferase [Chitinophaga jiangningensis]SHM92822.1 Fucose 4-O-acetylase [Chitinophaga jiangningensis]
MSTEAIHISRATRYQWIDYAKGIAIILVIYRHMLYGLQHTGLEVPQYVVDGNNMLFSFRMPLFFFLSGLFFKRGIEKRGAAGFLEERSKNLLYPYLIWAVIQISLQIIFARFANAQRDAWSYLDIFVQPRALDQLWYLFALFNVSALYLFNHSILRLNNIQQVALGLIFLGLAPLVAPWSTLYDVLLHYVFFAIGPVIASYLFTEKTQQQLAAGNNLLLLLPLFAVSQWYFLHHQDMNLFLYAVVALIGSAFMVLLSAWLAMHHTLRFLKTIGHYSLYIYLMHVMIAAVIRAALLKTGWIQNIPVLLLVLIGTSIPLSILAYRLLERLHMGWLFRGPFKTQTVVYEKTK